LIVNDYSNCSRQWHSCDCPANAGYKVTIAANGAEALRQSAIQTFHAVLMDVQMPVMDGLEATRRIREREHEQGLPRTPVVILTGDIREERVAEYRAAGSNCHLVKPVKISTLLAVIEDLRKPG
jgi:CheY-like chemotaxis protein